RVGISKPRLPRVAADGNPGLGDATPSGLESQDRAYPGQPQTATLGWATQPLQGWHSALSTQHNPASLQSALRSIPQAYLPRCQPVSADHPDKCWSPPDIACRPLLPP